MADEKSKAPRAKSGLKKMASCVGQYKAPAIFTSVLVALEVLFEILIPLIMAQIVNVGMVEDATSFTFTLQLGSKGFELFTMNNRVWFIVTCGAMMIVMALISLFFGTMSGRLAATASTGFAKNLRKKMFYKIENFSFANLDRTYHRRNQHTDGISNHHPYACALADNVDFGNVHVNLNKPGFVAHICRGDPRFDRRTYRGCESRVPEI